LLVVLKKKFPKRQTTESTQENKPRPFPSTRSYIFFSTRSPSNTQSQLSYQSSGSLSLTACGEQHTEHPPADSRSLLASHHFFLKQKRKNKKWIQKKSH
jgi:hypothetical protein